MFSIFQQIGNVFDSLISLIRLAIWIVSGLDEVISLFTSGLNSFLSMLDVFPTGPAEALMGVAGVLFILRILGRS